MQEGSRSRGDERGLLDHCDGPWGTLRPRCPCMPMVPRRRRRVTSRHLGVGTRLPERRWHPSGLKGQSRRGSDSHLACHGCNSIKPHHSMAPGPSRIGFQAQGKTFERRRKTLATAACPGVIRRRTVGGISRTPPTRKDPCGDPHLSRARGLVGMITVTQNVGRLAEIRVTAPINVTTCPRCSGTLAIFSAAHRVGSSSVRISRVLLSSRTTTPSGWRSSSGWANAKLERTAIVVCGAATPSFQVERLLREGDRAPAPAAPPSRGDAPISRDPGRRPARRRGPPVSSTAKRIGTDPYLSKRPGTDPMLSKRAVERKAFRVTAEAMTWLDEVLTSDERARLRMFLGRTAHRALTARFFSLDGAARPHTRALRASPLEGRRSSGRGHRGEGDV